MLGVDWRPERAAGDVEWDARMTELLAFRRQQGHVQVASWSHAPGLAAWLKAARLAWQRGLAAIGVQPMSQPQDA